MAPLVKLWRGFVRLFGLDTCPVPPAAPGDPAQEALRARLARRLTGRLPGR